MAPTTRNAYGAPEQSEIPPATQASLLITSLTTRKRSGHGDNYIKDLLDEVGREEVDIDTKAVSQQLEHKHRLFYVTYKSVLEELGTDKPLKKQHKEVLEQAADTLDTFVNVIRELPEILLHVVNPEHPLRDRGTEPLWVWLFPRILRLLGHRQCSALTLQLKRFFGVASVMVGRSPKIWYLNSVFFGYIKDCATVTLNHLKDPDIISHRKPFELKIHPSEIGDYVLRYEGAGISFDPYSYVLHNAVDSFQHLTQLLSLLVDISVQAANMQDATFAWQDHFLMILDLFLAASELQETWYDSQDHDQAKCIVVLSTAFDHLLSNTEKLLPETLVRKSYVVLAAMTGMLLGDAAILVDLDVKDTLCRHFLTFVVVCEKHSSVNRAVRLHTLPAIQAIEADEGLSISLGKDFQNSATALIQYFGLSNMSKSPLKLAHESFENASLGTEFNRLELDSFPRCEGENGPPSKRPRLSNSLGLQEELVSKLFYLLGSQEASDLIGLSLLVESGFAKLNDFDRCKAITYLGMIPCAARGLLSVTRDDEGNVTRSKCVRCDGLLSTDLQESEACDVEEDAILILANIIRSPEFGVSRRVRVLAMTTLRRFTVHFANQDFLKMETSALGHWCIRSLQSNIRELRIAAGRTLPQFISRARGGLQQSNRNSIKLVLHDVTEENNTSVQETCVLAWGQLGRILEDNDLLPVLHTLVKYLGHTHPIISGAAYNEILKLADLSKAPAWPREEPVERLLRPFWDDIAIEAVKDMKTKPQTVQYMADLLKISVTEFLVQYQKFTLPWLVLWQRKDVIDRIAKAYNKESWRMCMEPSNVVPILARLLIQEVPDLDTYTASMMRKAAPPNIDYKLDAAFFFRIDASELFLHLLRLDVGADVSMVMRYRHAIRYVASCLQTEKKPSLGDLVEDHILGWVSRLAYVVQDPKESISNKKRDVKVIEEIVTLGRSSARIARPQLCALLHVALSQTELQTNAFSSWAAMLRYLDDEDVELMLESTFASIIHQWILFDEDTRLRAEQTLQYLLKDRARLIRNQIVNLPSFAKFPQLADVESQLNKLRAATDVGNTFLIFSRRVRHESPRVVTQALTELKTFLDKQQSFLQASAVSEQPDAVISQLVRSIMDTCVLFSGAHPAIAQLSMQCIGLIGCLDPNRVDTVRTQREMVVVHNFDDPEENADFILFILQEVVVKAFLSATDTHLQGMLSFIMQELLKTSGFTERCAPTLSHSDRDTSSVMYRKWSSVPESVQAVLIPFMSSKFSLTPLLKPIKPHPIFRPDSEPQSYEWWIKEFCISLLHKPNGPMATDIFACLRRGIRIRDTSLASALLPYAVLHVVVKGTDKMRQDIAQELLAVLQHKTTTATKMRSEDVKLCSETIFRVLDYLSRWKQESHHKATNEEGFERVTWVLNTIPADDTSNRAIECRSYSRALFYWEQHMRATRQVNKSTHAARGAERTTGSEEKTNAEAENSMMQHLQQLYVQIDEPDGIEGISAHMPVLDIQQIILDHKKAGRWTAAQGWYEIELAKPQYDNALQLDLQVQLLTCLKESGQHDVLLNYVEGMCKLPHAQNQVSRLVPFATEASWATARWTNLETYVSLCSEFTEDDFNMNVGKALLAIKKKDTTGFSSIVRSVRERIAGSLTISTTSSIGSFHEPMLKLHVLTELEMIEGSGRASDEQFVYRRQVIESLDRRLETIGAYLHDKQYLLGIRRAAMQLSSLGFDDGELSAAWLTSARLARKGNALNQSYNAVLRASELHDDAAKIEHARLLWKEDQHRKAIQILRGAIDSKAFISHDLPVIVDMTVDKSMLKAGEQENVLEARAHLLLAKWLDSAGQTNSAALQKQYSKAARTHQTWEKGHYYLGRHYYNVLESQKKLPVEQHPQSYLTGECASLVITNYLRALAYGTKYIYQTLPRTLTLWLDFGAQVNLPLDRHGTKEFQTECVAKRKQALHHLNSRWLKSIDRMPAYMFYTALPQIMARITHPHKEVGAILQKIIAKIVTAHPQQALWCLLATSTSTQQDRKNRGLEIITLLNSEAPKRPGSGSVDMRALIRSGQTTTSEILKICNAGDFQSNRNSKASLANDLHFNAKKMPSLLAVPVEKFMIATLPTLTDKIKEHKAFTRDVVSIDSFLDEVLILNSLAKPRRLTAIGSDGQQYNVLCKPKDDLRKDQRLMEFNGMINRSFKRDTECSRRQLYIKTYAVTPLNEECGIIEWIDGLKTLRDILYEQYKRKGIPIAYNEVNVLCEEACKPNQIELYTVKVMAMFPPVFHLWFVQQFPEPSAWFAARLRYTRSCAVMSMVGHILGLGDRHGENILFQEGNGGTFHVDFNCLFEKGLSFQKPEKVPFRLTHNMVDAMGLYGYEGPFRKSSELTLKLLRQYEETLMTILEAFVYDPTLDLVRKDKSRKGGKGEHSAEQVLETIKRKMRGLLSGESIPLGVEGQVDELILTATRPDYLAGMYIGWCSFF